ncbi:MAG TPA: class I SAM-dependent methyltransferase [Xanthobacteraceae bacterium]|nr:class I SAM-dependent methyltransferase [Xanthobacteraceae bacterium]
MQTFEFDLDMELVRRDGQHCWVLPMPFDAAPGDSGEAPQKSALELFEDGRPLGPAHAAHDVVRNAGAGAFSHWHDSLYFSTSDNADPRSSGRRYTARAVRRDVSPEEADLVSAFRIGGERHNYPDLPAQDLECALDLARSTVENVIALLPEAERASAAAKVRRRLASLTGAMFEDVNGFSRSSPPFDEALAECQQRYRNGRSVHLELGSYIVWPDSRAEAFVAENELGDVIRLDMNLAYGPDVGASVTALPFPDESIDSISSNSLFEHVAYPHDIVREAFRVLRPGGTLVTTVPFHFVQHGCPNDYLRYTGQFFHEACGSAGFAPVLTDTRSTSGPYYTLHQFLKATTVGHNSQGPRTRAAQMAHVMTLALLAAMQGFDDDFDGGGPNHYHATRALAVKPGAYTVPALTPDRSKPFAERYPNLICPASGLPMRREGDDLVSLDGARRYPIENGIPNLFVLHGFGSSIRAPASSRRALAAWRAQQGIVRRVFRRLGRAIPR